MAQDVPTFPEFSERAAPCARTRFSLTRLSGTFLPKQTLELLSLPSLLFKRVPLKNVSGI